MSQFTLDQLSPSQLALLNSVKRPSSGNTYSEFESEPVVQINRKYKPYEDPLRGKSFKGKDISNFGIVEVVDFMFEDSGKQFVSFQSGYSIPISQLNEMFEPIQFNSQPNPNIAVGLEVEGEVNPREQARVLREQARAQEPQRQQQRQISNPVQLPEVQRKPVQQNNQFDPVFEILRKMKNNPTEVNLNIALSLPMKELFNTLNSSFENFEAKLVDFIFTDESLEDFKFALRQSIRQYYGLPPIQKEVKIEEPKSIVPLEPQYIEQPQNFLTNNLPIVDNDINEERMRMYEDETNFLLK